MIQQSPPARMRTINEAIMSIKEYDPQSAFTSTALRRMIKKGEIPSISVGNKYLVNLDVLFDYLNKPIANMSTPMKINKLQKINER